MSVAVKVLEEALGVESVLPNELGEVLGDTPDVVKLGLGGSRSSIDEVSSCVADFDIKVFLETLLCESLVDGIAEFSPLDVLASLWCFVDLAERLELRV